MINVNLGGPMWLVELGWMVMAAAAGWIAYWLLFLLAQRLAGRTDSRLDSSLVRHARRPMGLVLPLLGLYLAVPTLPLPAITLDLAEHVLGLGLIGGLGWTLVALTEVFEDIIEDRYQMAVSDNLRARRVQTQMHVLRRIFIVGVICVTAAVMLMTFPTVRNLGASLLASAGLAGLVAGIAARPALSNLVAGLQIALSEPIRLDDVVIVDGEWGRVEEITSTYVVVKIWDLRRLIVPLSYFIEQPFENWTRTTADLMGTVYLYADYQVPVEEVRQAFFHILEETELWDGKVQVLQVTNATEHTLELRALMSASDSGAAWDLRCLVREKLVAYLQSQHPECLPRVRADLSGHAAMTSP